MRLIISTTIIALSIGAVAWLLKKLWKRFEHGHPTTFTDKVKLTSFTFGIWVLICSAVMLGLSTSALGWQVMSIWLVKGILVLSGILTFLTYGTFRKKKVEKGG